MNDFESPRGSRRANMFNRVKQSFWFNFAAAILVVALVQSFVVKLYYIPSESMEGTLQVGDRVVVSRLAYLGATPATGDVVVFDASDAWEEPRDQIANPLELGLKWLAGLVGIGPSLDHTLVKRIVAGPGQTVACCSSDGRMLVDGEPIDEPYVINDFKFAPGKSDCSTEPISHRCVSEFLVPKNQYVVLGDNRSASSDSLYECRGESDLSDCVRTVQRDDIVGKLFVVLLPLPRFGPPDK